VKIRTFVESDTPSVVALWERCGLARPWNNPDLDIERKMSVQPELFLVGEQDGTLIASAMGGYDGHRGWVNYLAVDPPSRGLGFGRALMTGIEARLLQLGCPKINLQIRGDNRAALEFYAALGYAVDDVVSMGKRLIPDA
jgi:ribosomal protein S18 acetylase RimI-like enzyme